MRDFLSTGEVASRLGVSSETVRTLIKRGHFPGAYKIDPSRTNSPIRIPESEVIYYITVIQQRSVKEVGPASAGPGDGGMVG